MRYKYQCIDEFEVLDLYKNNPDFDSWYEIVSNILNSDEFQKRRLFLHHENESVWSHSIKVSFNSYVFAKNNGFNMYNCAIAGLLHDFYTRAWQDSEELSQLDDKYREKFIHPRKLKLFEKHGFTHPIEALENSREYFPEYMNKNIENAIVTHMFPLSLFTDYKMPNCTESFVIMYIDKKVSWTFDVEPKLLVKYVGVTTKQKGLNN